MRAMVFAAGLGTRLRPLTHDLPKPVVPLGDRPLCIHAIDHLRELGVAHLKINLHHLADRAEEAIRPHLPLGLDVAFSVEETLLGTAGGVRRAFANDAGSDTVVVMNGDILFWPDLRAALEAHRRHGAMATMILRSHPDPASLGAVEIDDRSRIRRILGSPGEGEGLSPYMFTGVHLLERDAIASLPAEGCIVRDGYRHWVDAGHAVYGLVDERPFRDVGTLRSYLEAHLELAEGRAPWSPHGFSAVHESAEVHAGARIERSVVMRGAIVEDGARLRDCVVWPLTRVRGRFRRTILTPKRAVGLGA